MIKTNQPPRRVQDELSAPPQHRPAPLAPGFSSFIMIINTTTILIITIIITTITTIFFFYYPTCCDTRKTGLRRPKDAVAVLPRIICTYKIT